MRLSALVLLAACAPQNDLNPVAEDTLFATGSDDELDLAVDLAAPEVDALAQKAQLGGRGDMTLARVRVDELGMAHVRVQQTLDGVPVFGGEAIVHLGPDGAARESTNALVPDVEVDTTPDLNEADAVAVAVDAGDGWEAQSAEPVIDLLVLRHDAEDHLVWRVQLRQLAGEVPTMPVVFVDAHDGAVVWRYDNLKGAAGTGSGTTDFYGTVSVNTYQSGSTWYLEDTVRDIGVYDFNSGTSLYYVTDTDNSWTSSSQYQAIDAMYAAAKAWDYYYYTFGRNNMDGSGGPGYVSSITGSGSVLTLGVRYSRNYVNAYWDGSMIVAGSGDGTNSNALTTVDILGHELSHAVSTDEANFTYSGESGAIDEANSDIFGAMIERYTFGDSSDVWWMGEDTWTPRTSGDALRYMNNPTADGSSKDYYADRYTGSSDNGGVHLNSGIGNLFFYILSEGGQHPRYGGVTVAGIGEDAAAAIWYRALVYYMTSSTNFSSARTATLSAAGDLYGTTSTQYAAVQDAWYDVGVGSSSSGSGGGSSGGGSTTCPSGYTTYTGSLSATGGTAYLPSSSGYSATSGTHYATLTGPSSADFDLYLQKYSRSRWSTVTSSTGSTSTESLSYSGSSGTYRVVVYSYSGSGSYTACVDGP